MCAIAYDIFMLMVKRNLKQEIQRTAAKGIGSDNVSSPDTPKKKA
jgi:hypothetical protein